MGSFVCPVLVFPYSILVIALKSSYSLVPSSHTLPGVTFSVQSPKMLEVFDNCVKQTLSHSSVIRNFTLLKTPGWWWSLNTSTIHLSWGWLPMGPQTTLAPQWYPAAPLPHPRLPRVPGTGMSSCSWDAALRSFLPKAYKTDGVFFFFLFNIMFSD